MADEKDIAMAAEETAVKPSEAPETAEAEVPVEAAAEEAPAATEEAPAEIAAEEEAPAAAEEATAEETAAEKTPAKTEEAPAEETKTAKDRVLTVIGILLCVILAPVLIVNITMIVKSYTTPDKVPSFGGYCPFIIMTDSMVPTINSGDLVFDKVVTDPTQVQEGDVISFFDPASRNNSIVTHRVVKIVSDSDGIAFTTKGDANNTEDDDAVPAKNVVGVYVGRLKGMGNVVMFMQSTPGLVVCIALPILLLIGYDALRRRKYEKRQQEDTAALLKELEELRAKQGK